MLGSRNLLLGTVHAWAAACPKISKSFVHTQRLCLYDLSLSQQENQACVSECATSTQEFFLPKQAEDEQQMGMMKGRFSHGNIVSILSCKVTLS